MLTPVIILVIIEQIFGDFTEPISVVFVEILRFWRHGFTPDAYGSFGFGQQCTQPSHGLFAFAYFTDDDPLQCSSPYTLGLVRDTVLECCSACFQRLFSILRSQRVLTVVVMHPSAHQRYVQHGFGVGFAELQAFLGQGETLGAIQKSAGVQILPVGEHFPDGFYLLFTGQVELMGRARGVFQILMRECV
jgi:hypothetical protein